MILKFLIKFTNAIPPSFKQIVDSDPGISLADVDWWAIWLVPNLLTAVSKQKITQEWDGIEKRVTITGPSDDVVSIPLTINSVAGV